VNINTYTKKDIGALGEKVAENYLLRKGYVFVDRNVSRKSGEIDLIMKKQNVLHFIEVKSITCDEFPRSEGAVSVYNPSSNLHAFKVSKVVLTSRWYMANIGWEEECQIDGALVWLRMRDRIARVEYLPQIQ
jgi:putative endonuclease